MILKSKSPYVPAIRNEMKKDNITRKRASFFLMLVLTFATLMRTRLEREKKVRGGDTPHLTTFAGKGIIL